MKPKATPEVEFAIQSKGTLKHRTRTRKAIARPMEPSTISQESAGDSRRLFLALVWLAAGSFLAAGAAAQQPRKGPPRTTADVPPPIAIETSEQLFATISALMAAGFQAEVSDANFHPVHKAMRAEMLRLNGPATEALRKFYSEHRMADPAATLSRFVSFALVAGPPPAFEFQMPRDALPPDVLALEGFNEVLAAFYQEAQIEKYWQSARPQYERELARVQAPLSEIVLTSTGYLRELLERGSSRRFLVYVEPMVGVKTNLRNYGDVYALVLNPAAELPLDDMRHAFLHFLLDPMPVRFKAVVETKRPLLEQAARAPRLPQNYRESFGDFVTECMVRAVELRLTRRSPSGVATSLAEADADGYVMVRPLYESLVRDFEKNEPSMSLFFPELLRSFSVNDELKRVQSVQFAEALPAAVPASAPEQLVSPEVAQINRLLSEGERKIAARDADAALAYFASVLERDPGNARALYGKAVGSAMKGDSEQAKTIFRRLVTVPESGSPPVDPVLRAWSHVYLGRIYDLENNRDLALSEYRAALAVDGAPERARIAARSGVEKKFDPASSRAQPNQ